MDSGKQTKAAKFIEPVSAIKTSAGYNCMHCLFLLVSSCKILTVNALNGCQLSTEHQECRKNNSKRYWSIEMNNACSLYLNTCSCIDLIDCLIKTLGYFTGSGSIGIFQCCMGRHNHCNCIQHVSEVAEGELNLPCTIALCH